MGDFLASLDEWMLEKEERRVVKGQEQQKRGNCGGPWSSIFYKDIAYKKRRKLLLIIYRVNSMQLYCYYCLSSSYVGQLSWTNEKWPVAY